MTKHPPWLKNWSPDLLAERFGTVKVGRQLVSAAADLHEAAR
jgi:hypothetical protein